MKIDKKIIQSINEKIEENKQSNEISSILIRWLEEIDEGKKNINTNQVIDSLINKIKL
jgi:alpha-amylase/alpha-mannosidase (GH57 family)